MKLMLLVLEIIIHNCRDGITIIGVTAIRIYCHSKDLLATHNYIKRKILLYLPLGGDKMQSPLTWNIHCPGTPTLLVMLILTVGDSGRV